MNRKQKWMRLIHTFLLVLLFFAIVILFNSVLYGESDEMFGSMKLIGVLLLGGITFLQFLTKNVFYPAKRNEEMQADK